MPKSWRVGQIFGLSLAIHWTWLPALALMVWSLATAYLPASVSTPSPMYYWPVAVLCSLLIFGSVVAHELSYAAIARHLGVPVHSVTLFLFGGISDKHERAPKATTEMFLGAIGPSANIVLGLALFLGFTLLAGALPVLAFGLAYAALANFLLALLNLLPGLPLDGGRVLRGLAWMMSGKPRSGTTFVLRLGQGCAALLVIAGVVAILTASFLDGLWLVFAGGLVGMVSGESYRRTVHDEEAEP